MQPTGARPLAAAGGSRPAWRSRPCRTLAAVAALGTLAVPLAIAHVAVGRPDQSSAAAARGLPWPAFVEVPAGRFVMGSDARLDPLAFDNERWSPTEAQGTVDLPTYYITRHEVTVAEFGAFTRAAGYHVDERALRAPPDHPVTFVSWPDALAYCRWLDAQLRAASDAPPDIARALRDGARVSLPSEAEWEKAARGADGRVFPWGNEPRRDRANFESHEPAPVGRVPCPECPYGLVDMAGNVWEWTRSPFQPYPYDPADDRANLDADALWVMRGGHYADTARNVRAATRGAADPGARRAFIGFRPVVTTF